MGIATLIIVYFGSAWFLFSLLRERETFSDYLTFVGVCIGLLSFIVFINPLGVIVLAKLWGMPGFGASLVFVYAGLYIGHKYFYEPCWCFSSARFFITIIY